MSCVYYNQVIIKKIYRDKLNEIHVRDLIRKPE